MTDPDLIQIIDEGLAGLFFEGMAQIAAVDMKE